MFCPTSATANYYMLRWHSTCIRTTSAAIPTILCTISTRTHQVFFPVLLVFALSSKSFSHVQIPNRTDQVFCPILQVLFLRIISPRTDQVFALSSKSIPYKVLTEHIKYFSPSSKYFSLSSKSFFYVQIFTGTDQVFALSSKYFSFVQILPERVKYFSPSSKYFLPSWKTTWRQ